MSATLAPGHHPWKEVLRTFLRETLLGFVLLTLVLVWRQADATHPSDTLLIRAGMLRDLAAGLPTGRQALVGLPDFLPLSGLAALPFLPFLPPAAYGYAYLFGLAGLLALASYPLRVLLCQWAGTRLSATAPLLLALAAAGLGPTNSSDLLACLAMLILALYFETRALAELRALAGVFWGLALFAHAAGLMLAVVRLLGAVIANWWKPHDAAQRAVQWIQRIGAAYLLAIYFFLNWMIMGEAGYPLHHLRLPRSAAHTAVEPLADALRRECPDRTPVVSGAWGYLIQPLLTATAGYHFLDFHPAKLPPEETRALVLVVPAPTNPLRAHADLYPDDPRLAPQAARYLLLAQTPDWRFYVIN